MDFTRVLYFFHSHGAYSWYNANSRSEIIVDKLTAYYQNLKTSPHISLIYRVLMILHWPFHDVKHFFSFHHLCDSICAMMSMEIHNSPENRNKKAHASKKNWRKIALNYVPLNMLQFQMSTKHYVSLKWLLASRLLRACRIDDVIAMSKLSLVV